jgi:predicted phage terminase large subunit-like protein
LQISPQEAAQELLRRRQARRKFTDFCRYIAPEEPPAKHHEILCDVLDRVSDGVLRRVMVFMPPGSAKSTYGSVRFPAYYIGKNTKKSLITASYGEHLANNFGRKVRNLVRTKEYQNLFPLSLAEDSQAKGEWETNTGCSYFACGVGSGITGRRADLGLIDDPVKGRQEADSDTVSQSTWDWYLSDFVTRLKPNAAQIIIQTRWSEHDLSGRILPEDWDGESGEFIGYDGQVWTVICIQAQAEAGKNDPLNRKPGEWLWTEWFTPDYWKETKLAQTKRDIRNWSCLYQQNPTPEDGTFFKREWFRRYTQVPDTLNLYITHDDAVTEVEPGKDPDFTEIGVWGVDPFDNIYAMDWRSGQETSDVWIEWICDLVERYGPFVVVGEGGVIRRSVEPTLQRRMRQRKTICRLEWLPTINDKPAKARNFQALASQGCVYFPYTEWANKVIEQCIKFPGGSHDDKVDACGLMGRAINQTWAPKAPKPKEPKKPITALPTLGEMLERHDRRHKRSDI